MKVTCNINSVGGDTSKGGLSFFAVVVAALLVAVVGGCGDSAVDSPQGAAVTSEADAGASEDAFMAFTGTFATFRSWPSAPSTADGAPVTPHTTGPMTVFINQRPKSGSHEFPVGTIIVKETDGGDPTARTVFAMVKRGGGFNADGARDWEWFELQNLANDGGVRILWRGVAPPAGEVYPGSTSGGCNGCHGEASTNDFVWSSALQLSTP